MKDGFIHKVLPDPSLRDYIRFYTFVDIPLEQAVQMEFLVMPASHTRMILFFGEPSLQKINGTAEPVAPYSLTGFCSKPHLFVPTHSVQQVMIHFTAWGVQPFLNFPLSEITDTRADLCRIFRQEADALCSALLRAEDLDTRRLILDRFFQNQLQKIRGIDDRAKSIIRYITGTHGAIRLDDLSKQLFTGERTVQRLVHNYTGINYKFFATLVRLEFVRRLMNNGNLTLTEVALKAGYFDQAHFIHEFKAMFGESPGAYLQKKHQSVWNNIES